MRQYTVYHLATGGFIPVYSAGALPKGAGDAGAVPPRNDAPQE